MPRWLHIVLQVLVQAAGGYASYRTGTSLPSVIAGGVSGVVGVVQQAYNTDGTPQAAPFPPPVVSPSTLQTTSDQESGGMAFNHPAKDAWDKIRASSAGAGDSK